MISKSVATEFYRDLCGTYNGDANKTCQGIASEEHIADTMCIPLGLAKEMCVAMIHYGITEKQGNCYVI